MSDFRKLSYPFLTELDSICKKLLCKKDRVMICITGKSGCGKSTFGKFVRKNGFGSISKYKIAVIDDSVMSLDMFYIFNRRIRAKSKAKDELEPFIKKLPHRKKVVFFVNTRPEKRLSCADIIVNLKLENDDERIRRLINRGDEISERHYKDSSGTLKKISHDYFLEVEVE